MKVTKEISSFDELYNQCWSGAKDTLDIIIDNDKEDELMQLLEEIFYDNVDETTLNDYLWFDREEIYEALGIKEE